MSRAIARESHGDETHRQRRASHRSPEHGRIRALAPISAGRPSEGSAIDARKMGRRGEAGAECYFGHGEARLLQQGMSLGQAQRSIMPRGTGGEAAGKQTLQATRRKTQASRERT